MKTRKKQGDSAASLKFIKGQLSAAAAEEFTDCLATIAFAFEDVIYSGDLDGFEVGNLVADEALKRGLDIPETVKAFREAVEAVSKSRDREGPPKDLFKSPKSNVLPMPGLQSGDSGAGEGQSHYSDFGYTDAGFVNRFFQDFVDDFYYVPEWDKWAAWTGTHWSAEHGQALLWEAARGLARDRSKKECQALKDEGFDEASEIYKKCERFFQRYRGTAGLRSFQEMARSDMRFRKPSAEFDQHPWLLNCGNGTLDLATRELSKPDPLHLITQQIKVDYNPAAAAPTWQQAMQKYMCGNQELVDYMQRFLGYCLTGSTQEQAFVVAHGEGSNGKGTIARIMSQLLGGYYKSAAANTFYKKIETAGHSDDLAGLRGARMVVASEADEAAKLDEGLIKRLTGEDCIRVAFKNQSFFEFIPTFKIMLAVNHAPRITGRDYGIWRRVHRVPFNYKVTIEERLNNPDFEKLLMSELEGILAWCVEGCEQFRKLGLAPPKAVEDAVEQYKKDTDLLGDFLADWCVLEPGASETAVKLYEQYKEHCNQAAEEPISQRFFGFKLRERNLVKMRGRSGVIWRGIRLKDFYERADDCDRNLIDS